MENLGCWLFQEDELCVKEKRGQWVELFKRDIMKSVNYKVLRIVLIKLIKIKIKIKGN